MDATYQEFLNLSDKIRTQLDNWVENDVEIQDKFLAQTNAMNVKQTLDNIEEQLFKLTIYSI